MAPTSSILVENKDENDIETIISSLPKEKGWWLEHHYKYKGFWLDERLVQVVILTRLTFKASPNNVILATLPKSGTTWFAALLFSLMNRTRYDFTTHPLLNNSPHDCVPMIEFYASNNPSSPMVPTTFQTLATHIPYELLPKSIIASTCPIIYVSRDPKDVFVSLWHFANKLRPKDLSPLGLEESFDMFCKGVSPFGSYWDHVIGYWKASLEMPQKVLFMRYEDMKNDPFANMKKLASFVGCPFSIEEEENGIVEKIVEFCSFESLRSFEINQVEAKRETLDGVNLTNNMFFRKGLVGDYKNYLTSEMTIRLKEIVETKFKGIGIPNL